MIHVLYIPVLIVCIAERCEFMQAHVHFVREAECRAVVEIQKKKMQEMSLKAGQMVTIIEGTCITAKDGML